MNERRRHIPLRRPASLLAALCCVLALAATGLAGEMLRVTPSVTLRETYDTNVNFNGKGDFEHSVAPALRVDMQKERMRGYVSAKGSAFKYTSLAEYDRIDQNYEAGLEMNATDKIVVNLKGGVTYDHAFTSSLGETGERSRRSSRQLYSAQPSVTFLLNETNSLTLGYAFAQTLYDIQDYTDTLSNSVNALWGTRLNERTQLLLQLSGGRVEARSAEQRILSAMTGFEYALAETLKARVLIGASTMRTIPTTGEERKASNYSADTSLEWRLEKMSANIGYSRDMTMGISGDDLVRDRFSLGLNFDLAERLALSLGGNLTSSRSTTQTQAQQGSRWMEVTPTLRYRLTEDSNLNLGYAYGSTKDMEKDELRTRNRVFLDYNIAFP